MTHKIVGLALAAGIVAAVATLALFWRIDPSEVRVYPGCPLYTFTGLYCPSCGGIRALHALLHGRLTAAAGHNAWLPVAVPVLICAAWAYRRGYKTSVTLPLLMVLALSGLLFWVARNLSLPPFNLLAP